MKKNKWRTDILTNEEVNTTNEEPDADTNAADFESIGLCCRFYSLEKRWLGGGIV